jgi:hypothetical protein
MSYEPKPGTVPERALQHLRTLPPGTEVMTSRLAEAIGHPPNNLLMCLETALKHGAVFRRQKDEHARSPFWWSLVDHAKKPRATLPPVALSTDDEDDAPPAAAEIKPADAFTRLATAQLGKQKPWLPIEDTPQQGANRDPSAGQSHGAGESESSAGRGMNGAPALGAAPVFPPMQASRAGPASDGSQKPNGRAHGSSTAAVRAGSDSAADESPSDEFRIALWSDGVLDIRRPGGHLTRFTKAEARAIVNYLESISLDPLREAEA